MAAEQTERDIDETRGQYSPVATNTQILYFSVSNLNQIDPMYQYSLEWFISIFINSIRNARSFGQHWRVVTTFIVNCFVIIIFNSFSLLSFINALVDDNQFIIHLLMTKIYLLRYDLKKMFLNQ